MSNMRIVIFNFCLVIFIWCSQITGEVVTDSIANTPHPHLNGVENRYLEKVLDSMKNLRNDVNSRLLIDAAAKKVQRMILLDEQMDKDNAILSNQI